MAVLVYDELEEGVFMQYLEFWLYCMFDAVVLDEALARSYASSFLRGKEEENEG